MADSPLIRIDSSEDLFLGKKISFDLIIDTLGINRFNVFVFLFVGIFFMAMGSEMLVSSLLINKFDEMWKLTAFEKGSLGSSIFFGFTFGSLASGYISDRNGRRPAYLIGTNLMLIFSVVSCLSQGVFSFIILRMICGFGVGLAVPALFALATELTPSEYRSVVLNNVWSVFPVGAAFVILMDKHFTDIENGWRYVLLFASFPCFFLIIFFCKIPESPMFLLNNGNYEKCFEDLNEIIKIVKMEKKISIRSQEKEDLIDEAENNQLNKEVADYNMLFTPKYQRLTYLICIIYFISSFNYYGATFILPQILKAEKENNESKNVGDVHNSLLIGCFFEVPTCILAGYLANHRYLYRVRTMLLGFFLNLLSCIFILMFDQGITISTATYRSSLILPFNVLFVYACEAYPTKIRSMGVGLGNSCSRFAAILAPIISQHLFDWNPNMLFVIFGLGSAIGIFSCISLPFETYHLRLK